MARAITRDVLGAWLLKADPRVHDELLALRASDDAWTTRRCVGGGYRSALMRPGDRLVLWASGADRGVWGLGRLTGPADEADGPLSVPVHVDLLARPVPDAELRAAGVGDLEVQRMPAGSNPSWVTVPQWSRLAPLLSR